MLAGERQAGNMTVPQIVKANPGNVPQSGGHPSELMCEGSRLQRLAIVAAHNERLAIAAETASHALFALLSLVAAQLLDRLKQMRGVIGTEDLHFTPGYFHGVGEGGLVVGYEAFLLGELEALARCAVKVLDRPWR